MMVPRPVDAQQSYSWCVSNRNVFLSVSWVTLTVEQLLSWNLQNHLQMSNRRVLRLISVFLRSSSSSLPSTASPPGHLQIIFNQTLQSQVLPIIHQHPPLSTIRIKAPHPSPPPHPLISSILNITLQYAFYISRYHLFNCICCTQKMLRIWIITNKYLDACHWLLVECLFQ